MFCGPSFRCSIYHRGQRMIPCAPMIWCILPSAGGCKFSLLFIQSIDRSEQRETRDISLLHELTRKTDSGCHNYHRRPRARPLIWKSLLIPLRFLVLFYFYPQLWILNRLVSTWQRPCHHSSLAPIRQAERSLAWLWQGEGDAMPFSKLCPSQGYYSSL